MCRLLTKKLFLRPVCFKYFSCKLMKSQKMLFLLILLIISLEKQRILSLTQRNFIAEFLSPCPNNNLLPGKLKKIDVHNVNNRLIINAIGVINETIPGPLEMTIHIEQCNMEQTKCNALPPIVIPDVCPFAESEFFGVNSFARVFPRLRCPVKGVSNLAQWNKIKKMFQ